MKLTRSDFRSVAIALACAALTCALRLSLDALLGSTLPYAFALGGVALAVYLAGWKASIVPAVLSPLWVNYFYVLPRYEFVHTNVATFSALVSYFALAAIVLLFGARASAALERERKARQEVQHALVLADRANEAWREADRQKDEFISILSHELRNPLGAISNAALLLRERIGDGESAPAARLLCRQVEQMRRLLDDLLDVARINRGLMELQCEPQDLRLCVQNAIEANAHLVEQAGQTLDVALPSSPVVLAADGARITQVVSNLINNATKYAGPGATIQTVVEPSGEGAVIVVRDDGVGIAPELLPHLFDRFQTERHDQRGIQGLGLGLWISQTLARLHGGTLTAASDGPGRGAEFRLALPCPASCDPRPG